VLLLYDEKVIYGIIYKFIYLYVYLYMFPKYMFPMLHLYTYIRHTRTRARVHIPHTRAWVCV